jgi:hypothetical protein
MRADWTPLDYYRMSSSALDIIARVDWHFMRFNANHYQAFAFHDVKAITKAENLFLGRAKESEKA